MSANDNMERVLRDIHVMVAKCPKYNDSNEQVIVDRKELLAQLDRLNHSVYQMMEQYEMTTRSRASAEREIRRRGDGIIENASAKAEDVYAAAVLYTADMLGRMQNLLDETHNSLDAMMKGFEQEVKEQKQIIRSNQTELESQLHDMHDTQKYLKLIQDVNREIQKEKERKARIKAMGIRKASAQEDKDDSDIIVHTDSEYFKQKQTEEENPAQEAQAEAFDDEPWEELPEVGETVPEEAASEEAASEEAVPEEAASEEAASEEAASEEAASEEAASEETGSGEAASEEAGSEEAAMEEAASEEPVLQEPDGEDDFELPSIEIDEEELLADIPLEIKSAEHTSGDSDTAEDLARDMQRAMKEEAKKESPAAEAGTQQSPAPEAGARKSDDIPGKAARKPEEAAGEAEEKKEKNMEDLLEEQLLADVEWIDSLQKE